MNPKGSILCGFYLFFCQRSLSVARLACGIESHTGELQQTGVPKNKSSQIIPYTPSHPKAETAEVSREIRFAYCIVHNSNSINVPVTNVFPSRR